MKDSIIDTCCLTNIATAGKLEEVVPQTAMIWHVPSAVAHEAIFIRKKDAAGTVFRQELDLSPLFASGILQPCPLAGGAETELYVGLAADLADGEAMGLAMASSRGWLLATDDRKARRVAEELGVQLICTPQIVRRWVDAAQPDPAVVVSMLTAIEQLAKFVPPPTFPESDWWHGAMGR
jgi:predicted nucleic acid-binding protein